MKDEREDVCRRCGYYKTEYGLSADMSCRCPGELVDVPARGQSLESKTGVMGGQKHATASKAELLLFFGGNQEVLLMIEAELEKETSVAEQMKLLKTAIHIQNQQDDILFNLATRF